eukprot:Rmarinus@m.10741
MSFFKRTGGLTNIDDGEGRGSDPHLRVKLQDFVRRNSGSLHPNFGGLLPAFYENVTSRHYYEEDLQQIHNSLEELPEEFRDSLGIIVLEFEIQAKFKRKSKWMVLNWLLGCVLAVLMIEMKHRGDHYTAFFCHVLLSVFTFFLCLNMVQYAQLEIERQRMKNPLAQNLTLLSSDNIWRVVLEVVFLAFHVPVGLDWYISHTYNCLHLYKSYVVIRYLRDHSPFFAAGGRLAGALSEVRVDGLFVVRLIMTRRPIFFVGGMITWWILMSAYCTYVFDRERQECVTECSGDVCEEVCTPECENCADNMAQAVYMTLITLSTVGYGDIVPGSIMSRIVTLMGTLMGMLLTAVMIAVVNRIMQPDNVQTKVLAFIQERQTLDVYRTLAAICLQTYFRHLKWKRVGDKTLSARYWRRLNARLTQLRDTRRKFQRLCRSGEHRRGDIHEDIENQMEAVEDLLQDVESLKTDVQSYSRLVLKVLTNQSATDVNARNSIINAVNALESKPSVPEMRPSLTAEVNEISQHLNRERKASLESSGLPERRASIRSSLVRERRSSITVMSPRRGSVCMQARAVAGGGRRRSMAGGPTLDGTEQLSRFAEAVDSLARRVQSVEAKQDRTLEMLAQVSLVLEQQDQFYAALRRLQSDDAPPLPSHGHGHGHHPPPKSRTTTARKRRQTQLHSQHHPHMHSTHMSSAHLSSAMLHKEVADRLRNFVPPGNAQGLSQNQNRHSLTHSPVGSVPVSRPTSPPAVQGDVLGGVSSSLVMHQQTPQSHSQLQLSREERGSSSSLEGPGSERQSSVVPQHTQSRTNITPPSQTYAMSLAEHDDGIPLPEMGVTHTAELLPLLRSSPQHRDHDRRHSGSSASSGSSEKLIPGPKPPQVGEDESDGERNGEDSGTDKNAIAEHSHCSPPSQRSGRVSGRVSGRRSMYASPTAADDPVVGSVVDAVVPNEGVSGGRRGGDAGTASAGPANTANTANTARTRPLENPTATQDHPFAVNI